MEPKKTRLVVFREYIGLNQTEMAKRIGIHQRNWSRYENGEVSTPEEVLIKLASEGLNLHWYHTGEGNMIASDSKQKNLPFAGKKQHSKKQENLPTSLSIGNGVQVVHGSVPDGLVIPWLDQAVSAGRGQTLEDEAYSSRFVTVPPELGRYPSLSALPVRGDSMAPTLHEGDLVVCDSGGWDGDGVYVIRTQEQAFVKRVVQTSKGYTVISDNKAYPSYSESREDVTIVGKVRCAVVKIE
jgi:phage repressor protein C with HTH and peptisase S24 domain